jgi:DNA-binding GntR family transcriptional regulator
VSGRRGRGKGHYDGAVKLARPVDLFVAAPRRGAAPLWRELASSLRFAIDVGRIPGGAALPSTRVLAGHLRVSRNTVAAAYDELSAEGYLSGRVGDGTYVVGPDARPVAPLHRRRWRHARDIDGNALVFFR